VSFGPEAPDRTRELARHYLEVRQPQRALDALGRASSHELDDPEVWALRGWALVDLDRHDEAARVGRDALGRWPGDVDFLRLLGVAEAHRDHLAEAEGALLAALELEPDDPHLLCTYADTLMRGGQLDKAEAVLDLAARADPDDVLVIRLRLNLAYLRAHDREARALAEELLSRDAEDHQGQAMLGSLDLDKVRLSSAERRLGSAIRSDPSSQGLARSARLARMMRTPLYWPLLPFERFGPGPTWLVAVAVIFGLRAAGLEALSGIAALVWLVLCLYSWTVGPMLQRRARGNG
jgi:tetratricopeptide (TPR) repeat protein